MIIFKKKGKKYLKIGNRAIQFDDYDDDGRPIIKPKIIKEKNKVKIKIPSLIIKHKSNG